MKVNLKMAISVYVCVFLGLTAFMVKNSIKNENQTKIKINNVQVNQNQTKENQTETNIVK